MKTSESLPATAVSSTTVAIGVTGVVAAIGIIAWLQPSPVLATCLLLTACAAPMWWVEGKRHARARRPHRASSQRHKVKSQLRKAGLIGTILLAAASIQLQRWLAPAWISGLFDVALPVLACLAAWMACYLLRPIRHETLDPIEALGATLNRARCRRHLRRRDRIVLLGWAVKAFFLPLMLAWTYVWVSNLWFASDGYRSSASLFTFGTALLYAVDTAFGTVGYLSTSRRIGAHIRSVDSTWLGWLSALACYPPLSLLVLYQWLVYRDGYEWQAWLSGHTWMSTAWGTTILLLTAIYTWATVAFGPRFSNLTHRGIITSGPFRYTKHPAYISKNLSWWMISVPFVSTTGTSTAVAHCVALLGVNAIYWLRAKTEERHLMRDPVYRQYAAWIARHGLLSMLTAGFGRRWSKQR